MQRDLPQGDPRLQIADPGSEIAVGTITPCIVFLEATLPGEIPLLAACWANSCHDYRNIGKTSHLALGRVLVVQNQSLGHVQRRRLWQFEARYEKTMFLICGGKAGALAKCDFKPTTFGEAPGPIFRWHVRYLSGQENLALDQALDRIANDGNGIAGAILRHADIEWPSIADALSSFQRDEKRMRPRRSSRPSLVRRLISAITGEPVPA